MDGIKIQRAGAGKGKPTAPTELTLESEVGMRIWASSPLQAQQHPQKVK